MSEKFRIGDTIRRTASNGPRGYKVGDCFTVKRVSEVEGGVYDTENDFHHENYIELVKLPTSIINLSDINELIDQVATGAIQRGGVQAKFVVSLDGNDVVIRLFGAAKK